MRDPLDLHRGDVVWIAFDPTRGQEQRGTRPSLVVSSDGYLANVQGLVVVVPITTKNRGWPHHVMVRGSRSGLPRDSFAMTEQPRTVSLERVHRRAGQADGTTMTEVDQWLRDFLTG